MWRMKVRHCLNWSVNLKFNNVFRTRENESVEGSFFYVLFTLAASVIALTYIHHLFVNNHSSGLGLVPIMG